jgi:hypothetical protein
MITAKNLRGRLAESPFRPFRICLGDGAEIDIPHREFAWVFGNRVFVGVAENGDVGADPRVREISDLHITRLEEPPGEKKRGSR